MAPSFETVWEGPRTREVVVAPLATEPIEAAEHTHPLVDPGPADPEPEPASTVIPLEPIPAHVFDHPLIDAGTSEA